MTALPGVCIARVEHLAAARAAIAAAFPTEPWEMMSISQLRAAGWPGLLFGPRRPRAVFFAPDLSLARPLLPALGAVWLKGRRSSALGADGRVQPVGVGRLLSEAAALVSERLKAGSLLRWAHGRMAALKSAPAVAAAPRSLSAPRILYLRSDLWFGTREGGAMAHTLGMIGGFAARNAQIAIVAPEPLPVGGSPACRMITVRPDESFRRSDELPEIAYNRTLERALPDIIQTFRPDFIYQRLSLFNFAGADAARAAGRPLVLEYNGSFPWIHRNWGRPLKREALARQVEDLCLSRAVAVSSVSSVLRDELIARGVAPERALMLPNGVDLSRFPDTLSGDRIRRALGWEKEIVIGFVGTFSAWHGAEVLAAAAGVAARANPNLRFLFVGDGPLAHRSVQLIDRAGVAGRAHFAGSVPHQNVPEFLVASDILASPHVPNPDGSPFFGSPTKLFEYMAAGRAIVASRLGQIGDVLEDGETAVLVPPGDADALAKALLDLAADRDRRRRLGAAARRQAARFTWESNAKTILEVVNGQAA